VLAMLMNYNKFQKKVRNNYKSTGNNMGQLNRKNHIEPL
jgi:hypothetical protein